MRNPYSKRRSGYSLRRHVRQNARKSWGAGRIPVKEVRIRRAEGKNTDPTLGRWMTFDSLAKANQQLYVNSRTAPEGGAYDKHDFVVTWADGKGVYKGRYDLHKGEYGGIGGQIKNFLTYIVEKGNLSGFTAMQRRSAKRELEKYKFD